MHLVKIATKHQTVTGLATQLQFEADHPAGDDTCEDQAAREWDLLCAIMTTPAVDARELALKAVALVQKRGHWTEDDGIYLCLEDLLQSSADESAWVASVLADAIRLGQAAPDAAMAN